MIFPSCIRSSKALIYLAFYHVVSLYNTFCGEELILRRKACACFFLIILEIWVIVLWLRALWRVQINIVIVA